MTALLFAISGLAAAPVNAQTLGVPNTGNVPPAGSPVQIEDCVAGNDGGGLLAKSDGAFKVVFTNEGRMPADVVRFRIAFGNEEIFVRDVGSFASGITITHIFKKRGGNVYSSPLFSPAKLSCAVDAVHFKDGSDWTPAAAAASIAQTQAVKPIGDGYLGIVMEQAAEGVAVRLLIPDGPGRKGGIMQGDVVEKIDDQHVTTVSDATMLISAMSPGSQLKVTVRRGGQDVDLTIIVGHRPPS